MPRNISNQPLAVVAFVASLLLWAAVGHGQGVGPTPPQSIAVACSQLPALTGDVTTVGADCATTLAKIQGTAITGTTGSGKVLLQTSPSLVTPALGIATGTSLALGGATLGSNVFAATGHLLLEGVTSTGATGTGLLVFGTSPSLTTPALGVATATSLAIGGATIGSNGLAVTGHLLLEGVTSTGATGTNLLVFGTSPTLVTPVLGVATATSLAIGGATIGSNGLAVTGHLLLEGVTSTGATGTNLLVFATSPTLTTPVLGVATATSINGNTLTTGSWTLTGAASKTLTFSNTVTLTATDGSTLAIGGGGTLGTAAYASAGTLPATGSATIPAVGFLGTTLSASVAVGSPISLTNNTAANVTSITPPAGNWLVFGQVQMNAGGGTTSTLKMAWINTVTAATPSSSAFPLTILQPATFATSGYDVLPLTPYYFSTAGGVPIYLGAQSTFAVSTMIAFGYIYAIKMP